MNNQAAHPRMAKRAIPLICLLCAVAGSVDAAAYLLCGRVFVANMTGNTVLFAISLLQRNPREAALRAGLVVTFVAGVVIARLLAKRAGDRLTKTQRLFVLSVESLVLLVLAWKNAGAHTGLLLLLLACVLGIQNGAFRYIGGLHLNTAFITGDLEQLGEAIINPRDPLPKVSAFLWSWIGYGGGGLLGALSALELPHHGFLVSMILALASLLTVAFMPEQAEP